MDFSKLNSIYFLGIGGIGMSALARYFKSAGKNVSGYDKTRTELTDELEAEGIKIHFTDDVKQIDQAVILGRKNSLIIYTPAIPSTHSEYQFFLKEKFDLHKRSEVLGLITQNHFTIAVAGTHGKTTTSSMIAHILKASGKNCLAFLGGIAKNYNSNLLLPENPEVKPYVVVEADEYDRSFLALSPTISVITSMDADHLDIYGNESYMIESYRLFAKKLAKDGKLIYKKGLPLEDLKLDKRSYDVRGLALSTVEGPVLSKVEGQSEYAATNIQIRDHQYHFDWKNSSGMIEDVSTQMPGLHNVENTVAAIAVARAINIPDNEIKNALASYNGVRRRFDYQLTNANVVYIDDYAHHPEELRACISSVKELYPGKKILGIFQPHLFSRTRDFTSEFAESLSLLDSLLLLEIYPARELPIPGITSNIIFDKVHSSDKVLCAKEDVIHELEKRKCEVILTLGAGDIDQLVHPITDYLKGK